MKPAILPFFLTLIGGGAAFADTVCMPAHEMEASLIDWYAEEPVDGAVSESAQIWASEITGTWTLVEYRNGGMSCVLAQGTDWSPRESDTLLLAALDN